MNQECEVPNRVGARFGQGSKGDGTWIRYSTKYEGTRRICSDDEPGRPGGTLEPSYPGDWQKEGARVLEIWTH
jgi:hypothetical protein